MTEQDVRNKFIKNPTAKFQVSTLILQQLLKDYKVEVNGTPMYITQKYIERNKWLIYLVKEE